MQQVLEQKTAEGTFVVCVARDGCKMATIKRGMSFPIWITGTYVAKRRKDGILTWRRDGSIGRSSSGNFPSEILKQFAKEIAIENGVDYKEVRHGKVCE